MQVIVARWPAIEVLGGHPMVQVGAGIEQHEGENSSMVCDGEGYWWRTWGYAYADNHGENPHELGYNITTPVKLYEYNTVYDF